ncbi:MAG: thiol-disulfide oxidoreductase DCC family protein [Ignavibacteriaceae bacterium]|nr:thiol-disulfide oxidoreductase DCC family protein [Ignavibacteriaceae bacterium]
MVTKEKIILFDGVCNFCNFWVNFIIDRDSKNVFIFAALQSEKGQEILGKINFNKNNFDTFVLIDVGSTYTKSTAALKISKDLKSYWKYFYYLIFIPQTLRDFFYEIIAKNRYRFFGKRNACRIPTEEEKRKFLS